VWRPALDREELVVGIPHKAGRAAGHSIGTGKQVAFAVVCVSEARIARS